MSTDSSLPPSSNIVSPRPQQPLFANQSSYFLPPTPPPATPPPPPSRISPKRPSLSASAAMNWLSHKSSNSIASFTSLRTRSNSLNKDQAPSLQTLRISGPITLEEEPMHPRPKHHQLPPPVARPLGLGAEVVGTPAEALERPARVTSPPNNTRRQPGAAGGDLPPIPQSPPSAGGVGLRSSKSSPHLKSPTFHYHSRTPSEYSNALRSPPPVRSSFRTGGVGASAVVPPLTPFPTPPSQQLNIPSSEAGSISVPPVAPQAKFSAVLLSSNLDAKSSRKSQVIVTLETSTEVFKTTLSTLTSRPSHAAAWFESVVKSGGEEPIEEEREEEVEELEPASTTSSVPPSPFTRVFQDHLTSQGLRASVPSYREIHLFMDRSSAPYPHILNYLRSPVESTALPRAVQLGEAPSPTSTHDATKVDALLELRDEAAYLGLEGLVLLCEVELRKWYVASRRHSAQQHKPTQSTSTAGTTAVASRPTSTSSLRTSTIVPTTTTTTVAPLNASTSSVPPPPPPRSIRRAASHRILSPTAVPESIKEDDLKHNSDGGRGGAAAWSEFGVVTMRPTSSISEDDDSSGVYDNNEDSSSSSAALAPAPTMATLTIHTNLRTSSPETITRATAAAASSHFRSHSSSAIPLGMSPFPPNPNRPLPDVPSSTSSSAVSTPTTAPAPLAPSVGLGLRTRNRTRSRSNSRSEGVSGVVRPTIIPPATITGAGRGGAERHQRGNSFLPSLMSPTTPKTAGSSANWI